MSTSALIIIAIIGLFIIAFIFKSKFSQNTLASILIVFVVVLFFFGLASLGMAKDTTIPENFVTEHVTLNTDAGGRAMLVSFGEDDTYRVQKSSVQLTFVTEATEIMITTDRLPPDRLTGSFWKRPQTDYEYKSMTIYWPYDMPIPDWYKDVSHYVTITN